VRGDILLGNDDFTIPSGWSINPRRRRAER
jgi:hypothetical protein